MNYQTIITNPTYKYLVQDCYEDYVEECEADWQTNEIDCLSKADWLKTDDAKSFIMLVYKRREAGLFAHKYTGAN